ncbi:BRO family protein [Anaerotignum lactatifermentans]|uniref:BRO family protein n=1 Tax=Anaerotignum lactatifermentans TaxID=160404 RepID=UPI00266D2388|nr:BRO family protein [Anaerotignum lactatifermentans]
MNELQIFENAEFGSVRTLMINAAPYFVGKDVAEILGYANASKAVLTHVDDEDKTFVMLDIADSQNGNVPIGQSKTVLINESGLYSLILSSKMPNAKKFKHWVTADVLPSIRKHGAYMTQETLEAAIMNPDMMIKLCTALKDEQNRNKVLQAANASLTVDNQIMKPKADYFDELVDRNLLTNFRDTAKQLHVGERKFIKFLLEKKYIYRDKRGKLKPYANKYEDLFDVKEFTNDKTGFCDTQTLITPKGRETFRLLLLKAGI